MLLPHIANVVNKNSVSTNMAFHGRLETISLKSCLIEFFWLAGGRIRSLAEKNVITSKTTATAANNVIVTNHPFCASPCPNLATRGNVSPCTMKVAMVAVTKRMEDMLVRCLISLVMTPPKEA